MIRPVMLAWLLTSAMTNTRDDDESFDRCIDAEQRLMDRLNNRELLAIRHEALFDDGPSLIPLSALN